jgi:hypothetical protein
MAKSKKRRWLEHREYTSGHHQLRDARTGKTILSEATRAEVDAYIAKVTETDGMTPEISYDYRR